jgi:hypothetical protein
MESSFNEIANEYSTILQELRNLEALKMSTNILNVFEEIDDGIRMLALRSKHVRLLYESRDVLTKAADANTRQLLLYEARDVINNATIIVRQREKHYRVPWQRIASWRENPTVYRFGYLWAVHSLYYWWRDQGLAEGGPLASPLQSDYSLNPCYLNRMDVSEVAVGWGKYTMELLRNMINRYSPFSSGYPVDILNCFVPPTREFVFPNDLEENSEF